MAEFDSGLCLYSMPDGSVLCTSCSSPPEGAGRLGRAPEGMEEGEYEADDPRVTGIEPEPSGGP